MSTLRIFSLGSPHVEFEGKIVEIKRRKAMALLAYLATMGDRQRRDTFATLLWPESDQSGARKALRRDLTVSWRALYAV